MKFNPIHFGHRAESMGGDGSAQEPGKARERSRENRIHKQFDRIKRR
jgi:hypothetical protein